MDGVAECVESDLASHRAEWSDEPGVRHPLHAGDGISSHAVIDTGTFPQGPGGGTQQDVGRIVGVGPEIVGGSANRRAVTAARNAAPPGAIDRSSDGAGEVAVRSCGRPSGSTNRRPRAARCASLGSVARRWARPRRGSPKLRMCPNCVSPPSTGASTPMVNVRALAWPPPHPVPIPTSTIAAATRRRDPFMGSPPVVRQRPREPVREDPGRLRILGLLDVLRQERLDLRVLRDDRVRDRQHGGAQHERRRGGRFVL
jgi:hypothetical protein